MTNESMTLEIAPQDQGFWQAPYGMCIVSLKGEFLKVNGPMSNITGYSEKELLSRTIFDVTHPEDIEITSRNYKKAKAASPKPFQCKKRYLTKDSNMIWILVNSIGIKDRSGKVFCFLSRVQDVSDKQAYEEILNHDSLRYETALKYSNLVLIDWDMTSDDGFYTKYFHEKLGYKDKEFELTSEKFYELVHPLDRERRKKALDLAIKENKNYDIEYRIMHKDGHYLWVHARASIICDDHGNLLRLSGILEDISDRKSTELEMSAYVEELEEINKNMESFAHVISHDLKEPIRGIANNLLFLEEELEGKELSSYAIQKIGRINHLCDRMDNMISALMNFVQYKSNNQEYSKTNLNEVLEQLNLEITSSKSNVRINVLDKLPNIVFPKTSIKEVFSRLIQNGIENNDSKNKIVEIGYKKIRDPKYTHLFYVKDNGIGIEEVFLDKIFDIFKKIDSDRGNNDNMGIGLTITKKIIESHHGLIWVESKPKQGTSVFFCLP